MLTCAARDVPRKAWPSCELPAGCPAWASAAAAAAGPGVQSTVYAPFHCLAALRPGLPRGPALQRATAPWGPSSCGLPAGRARGTPRCPAWPCSPCAWPCRAWRARSGARCPAAACRPVSWLSCSRLLGPCGRAAAVWAHLYSQHLTRSRKRSTSLCFFLASSSMYCSHRQHQYCC